LQKSEFVRIEDFPVDAQSMPFWVLVPKQATHLESRFPSSSWRKWLRRSFLGTVFAPSKVEEQVSNLMKATHDHEEIRKWAELRGGKPTQLKEQEVLTTREF
jgi:hypothetical protein